MAKQKNVLFASIAIIAMLIALILGGCGQKPEDVPVDGSDISLETEVSGAETPTETPTPAAPEKENEETPVSTEEEIVLTSDSYLTELSQGDCLEFKYSDYNSDYKVGNRITLSVTMESRGLFNGCIGTNVGSSYEWQQEEFDFEAGTHTATWTVTPSLDSAQLNLWYADSAPVGVISIEVTIEEVEPAVIGKLATFTEQDTFEFTLSEYNSLYKVGNLVKISVVLESDGDFNGSIGASVGKDYTWNQKEFKYDEGGKYTLSWTVKPSSDYSNIGIWWVGGTSVGIHSITVTVLEEEIGIHGDYITMFTDEGNFEFVPSLINPSFKFGDKIRITATLESDGEFTGSMGTCVGSNYEWTQIEYESDTGISTWVLDISPVIDSVQLGIWYIGGTAVGVLDIDIEILKWGYQHVNIKGNIYTSTEKNDTYTFMPSDYCDFEDGDVITIRVELDSNEVYNGCISVNDINGTNRSANYSSNGGTVFCELVVEASTKEEAKIEFWWMNTKVALNSITVTKGGTIVDTNDDDTFLPNETKKFRTAANYCDYKQGDTITVAVTLSGDGYFKGSVGMSGTTWIQNDFESADGSPVTCTIKVPNAVSQTNDIQIGVWWSEGSYVHIDNITVTKEDKDPGDDDNKPGEDDKIDTSNWQLAFNGFGTDWSGWNSVNGSTGKLEFSAKIKDIMDVNNYTDISELGGFIFQIWHVDSKYNGKTYTYKLDINGVTFKEGEETIDCNEYNSTDVITLTMSDYSFSPEDEISCVIIVSDAQEPVEPGDAIYTFTYDKWAVDSADAFIFSPSKYGDFETGDTIIITVDFESISGQYNGTLGVSDANDDWQSAGTLNNTNTQWTLEVPNASKNNEAQVQMWWMEDGASAKITNISVTKKGEESGPIHTFTYDEWKAIYDGGDTYSFDFSPSSYGDFETGDTIIITVTFDQTAGFYNGIIGVSDASNTWTKTDEMNNSNTQWTLEVPNASKNNGAQVQIYWMNEDVSATITDISVTKKEEENAPVHTFTYDEWKAIYDGGNTYSFSFSPSSYGDFETGDTIIITVTFDQTAGFYNGIIGVSDASNTWTKTDEMNNSNTQWTLEVPNASKNNGAQVQIYWMNEDVSATITDISVTKKEEENAPVHTFTYDEWKAIYDGGNTYSFDFSPSSYGDFETGDTIIITVTFDQTAGFYNGIIGVSDASNTWTKTDEMNNSNTQWTLEVPNASKNNGAQVQIYWMNENVSATITDITVTKKDTTRALKMAAARDMDDEEGKNITPTPDIDETDTEINDIPTVSGGNNAETETDNTDTVSGNDAVTEIE